MNKNEFALTPPMGWNSYDYYDTTVTEEDVKRNADYMAANLKKYGWEYIVVDIEWFAHNAGSIRDKYQYIPFNELEMDEYSRLLPDPARFPSAIDGAGFKPLADYVHNLGLKFGIHIMRGIPRNAAHGHCAIKGCDMTANDLADPSSICKWNPDMYGVRNCPEGQLYYDSLIELYASWGVDFIKCDDICNTNAYPHDPYSGKHEIEMLHNAIIKVGRPIVLSLSPGPALIDKAWHYEKNANMWRITDDFWDNWDLLKDMFTRCELWQNHVSEGNFPDCDMLPLGYLGKGFGSEWKSNFTYDEAKTMMTLWCLFGSPLMLGGEMPRMDEETVSLLTNDKLLALLPPYVKPLQIRRDDAAAVWVARDTKTHSRYIALFNISDNKSVISENLADLFEHRIVSAEELWTGELVETDGGMITKEIDPHACAIFKLAWI